MPAAAIEIEQLVKRFERPWPSLRRALRRPGPDVVDALRGVSLSVAAGEMFGLVGRNGQGKTTLMKCASCLLEPTSGSVRVFGKDSVREAHEVKRRVGLVSADERSFYFRLSGRDNLRFFARLLGLDDRRTDARVAQLVDSFELGPVLDRPFQEYSTGNKQRLAIARALLADPPLLLLDEPTRSLDPISAQGLRNALRAFSRAAPDKTVLITTHDLAEIEALCGRVAVLSKGRIIDCASVGELRRRYAEGERVTVRVTGPIAHDFVERQRASLGELSMSRQDDGTTRLTLARLSDDTKLHVLLDACLRAGLRVVGCETERFGLMQVLERIDAAERAA